MDSAIHQEAAEIYISVSVTSNTEGKQPAASKSLDQIPQFTVQSRKIWVDRRHSHTHTHPLFSVILMF